MYVCSPERNCVLAALKKGGTQIKEGDSSSVFCSGRHQLKSCIQRWILQHGRHGPLGVGPGGTMKMNRELEYLSWEGR